MSKELDRAITIASGDVCKDDIKRVELLMRSGKECESEKFITLINGIKERLKPKKADKVEAEEGEE